jgi:hypothetical protein
MTLFPDDFDFSLEEPIAVRPRASDVDLEEYIAMGKVPWEDRAEKIQERFPSVAQLDWSKALEADLDLFARVLRDILKMEQAIPGQPGPRPSLDIYAATRRMEQLYGRDFSLRPFKDALRVLAGDRSVRHLARFVRLDRNYVHRLLTGQLEPDGYALRMCAEAFGKHPSYFLEWRILFIIAAVTRRLEWTPETSVSLFRRLDMQQKNARLEAS